jgi:hypothetical protein
VAVWTKNAEVLQTVVELPTIDVIEFDWDRITLPLCSFTMLASMLFGSVGDEPQLQRVAIDGRPTVNEIRFGFSSIVGALAPHMRLTVEVLGAQS